MGRTRTPTEGIATRLIKQFEQRAEGRGCRTFYLETFSFQAPSLYRSIGYIAGLELHGFSPGISKYTMVRHIDDAEADARCRLALKQNIRQIRSEKKAAR